MNNNQRLKLIYGALLLNDKDLARATTLGGVPTSRHRANSWMRAKNAAKMSSGRAKLRYVEVTQQEFDAFLVGLKPLLDELEVARGAIDDE